MIPLKKIWIYIVINVGLFILGLVLVYAFLEHSVFYKFSLPLLVVVGALLTFAVLKTVMVLTKLRVGDEKPQDVMVFTKKEKDKVLMGTKTQMMFPPNVTHIRKGQVLEAKLSIMEEKPFCTIKVVRSVQKNLGDLSKQEIMKEGFETRKQLIKALDKRHGITRGWVTIIGYEVLE